MLPTLFERIDEDGMFPNHHKMTSTAYADHFSQRNIPFGIASSSTHRFPQAVTRIGNSVIFLHDLNRCGLFSNIEGVIPKLFDQPNLNEFAASPASVHRAVRDRVRHVFSMNKDVSGFPAGSHENVSSVTMHLPVHIGDFLGEAGPI